MSAKTDEMGQKIAEATRQMVYDQIREEENATPSPTGSEMVGLDALLPPHSPVDVAKVRAEAESWLKTYPVGADAMPSDAWDWLNGRCHPRIVLALCERIAELETKL